MRIIFQIIFYVFLFGCSLVEDEKNQGLVPIKNSVVEKDLASLAEQKSGPSKNSNIFVDKTEQYGLNGVKGINFYAVDFDNNGNTDLVVISDYNTHPDFYRYNKLLKKFEKLPYNPLGEFVRSSYLVFADFNKDGVLDLLVGVLNQKSELSPYKIRLFRGLLVKDRISYIEENSITLEALPTAAISVFDFDLDGMLDIFIGNWFKQTEQGPVPVPDKLLKGIDSFKFIDVSNLLATEMKKDKTYGVYENARPTFGVSTCDLDQNGFADILTSSNGGYGNKLWYNLFDNKTQYRIFHEYGDETNYSADQEGRLDPLGGGNTFFSSCADYNNDGIMDIFVAELTRSFDNNKRDRSSILTGSRETFPQKFVRTEYLNDVTAELNWNQGDRRAIWFDYNLDGNLDLLVDNSGFPPHSRLVLFEQKKDHSFDDVSKDVGIDIVNPSGSVVLDVNKDGKLDIITGSSSIRSQTDKNRIYLFENNFEVASRKSLRIYLNGKKANITGLGSMIILQTNTRVRRHWVEYSQGGLSSQNEEGIIFGIEKGEKLEQIMVRWPYFNKFQKKYTSYHVSMHDVSRLTFTKSMEITLCENEKILIGKSICH